MSGYLIHYGIPRMHWGERRWQNSDGSLTPAGRVHYGVGEARDSKKYENYEKAVSRIGKQYNSVRKNGKNSDVANEAIWRREQATKLQSKVEKKQEKYDQAFANKGKYAKGTVKAEKKLNDVQNKAARADAAAKGYEALTEKLKQLEFKNLQDGVYYAQLKANRGKDVLTDMMYDSYGDPKLAMDEVNGPIGLRIGTTYRTSLTNEQVKEAIDFAESVYWKNLPMPPEED